MVYINQYVSFHILEHTSKEKMTRRKKHKNVPLVDTARKRNSPPYISNPLYLCDHHHVRNNCCYCDYNDGNNHPVHHYIIHTERGLGGREKCFLDVSQERNHIFLWAKLLVAIVLQEADQWISQHCKAINTVKVPKEGKKVIWTYENSPPCISNHHVLTTCHHHRNTFSYYSLLPYYDNPSLHHSLHRRRRFQ